MPSNGRALTLAAVAASVILLAAANARTAAPRFLSDDPLWIDNDRTVDVKTAREIELDDYYDFLENSFGSPGDRSRIRALNVNTVDEVPDSSWFENRIGRRGVPLPELVRGPDRENIQLDTKWTIVRGKNRGFHPGFRAIDRSDPTRTVYQLEFDPPRNPELASGAEIIGAAFYHAFGYHTAEVRIVDVDPAELQIAPQATIRDANGRRKFVRRDLEEVLKNAARMPNGHIRASAERRGYGDDMGRFEYHGLRPDDPNDIYPHEHRRELRGSRVFAAWLNHDDSRAVNTQVLRHRESGRSYLKYYLVDFGSLLGSATRFPNVPQSGHEHVIKGRESLLTLLSLGLYVRPWLRQAEAPAPSAVGRFSANGFDPRKWVAEYPKAAYDNMRDDDAFWAARIVARFSDEAIRAIVGKARYSEAAATEAIVAALIARRDRIKDVWLTAVNPIVNPSLSPSGELRFENAAVEYGVGGAPEGYALQWSRFDNAADVLTPLGAATTVTEPRAIAPDSLFGDAEYVSVSITTRHARYPGWKPVQVYFRRGADRTWQTVGLDRGLP